MTKRIISFALCLLMLAALVPFSAVSAETLPETASGAYQLEANTPLMNSQATGITNNAVYKIRGYNSNYYITLRNYNIASPSNTRSYDTNLNNVEVDTNTSLSDQEFRVVYNSSSDTYYIKAIKSADGTNRQLDVLSANASQIVDGKNIHIYAPGDENSSQWLIVSLGSGVYKIVLNYNQNLAITRTSGNNVQVNTYTGSSSQKWTFEEVTYTPVPITTNSIFRIKDLNSGLYVSVPGNDANLSNVALAVGDSSSAKQKFKFVYDTTNDVYYIKAMMSSNGNNRLLDVNSTASQPPVNGRNVHIYTAGDFTSSAWLVDDINGSGLAKIYMNYNNHLVLTAASGGTSAGTNIQVNNYTGEAYQKWILEPVDVPVTGIQLNETNVDLIVGQTCQLYASISPSNLPQNVTWTSSMPSVATVDSDGLVTATGFGFAYITATYNNVSASAVINVDIAEIESICGIYKLKHNNKYLYSEMGAGGTATIGMKTPELTVDLDEAEDSSVLWAIVQLTSGYYSIISMHTRNYDTATYGYYDYILSSYDAANSNLKVIANLGYSIQNQWQVEFSNNNQSCGITDWSGDYSVDIDINDNPYLSDSNGTTFQLIKYTPVEYHPGDLLAGKTTVNGKTHLDVVILIYTEVLDNLGISYTPTVPDAANPQASSFTEIPYFDYLKDWSRFYDDLCITVYPCAWSGGTERIPTYLTRFADSYCVFVRDGETEIYNAAETVNYTLQGIRIEHFNQDYGYSCINVNNYNNGFYSYIIANQKKTLLHEFGHSLKLRHPSRIYYLTPEYQEEHNFTKVYFAPASIMKHNISVCPCVLTVFDHLTLLKKMEDLL